GGTPGGGPRRGGGPPPPGPAPPPGGGGNPWGGGDWGQGWSPPGGGPPPPHRSTCPPSAAVGHRATSRSARRWSWVSRWAAASPGPHARTTSANSRLGRSIAGCGTRSGGQFQRRPDVRQPVAPQVQVPERRG